MKLHAIAIAVLGRLGLACAISLSVAGPGSAQGDRPSVWVHYDYVVEPDGTSFAPDPAAIQMVVDVFKQHGITLHIDPQHTAIPLGVQRMAFYGRDSGLCPDGTFADFDFLKAQYFHPPGNHEWHYAVFDDQDCTVIRESGQAELPGDDLIVNLGSRNPRDLQSWNPYFTAVAFMHELGHNLGLQHGGGDSFNHKPNYLSVMNYDFPLGIPVATTPQGTTQFDLKLDYSEAALPTLDEAKLDERAGLGAGAAATGISLACGVNPFFPIPLCTRVPGSGPMDWNQDGIIEPEVVAEVAAPDDSLCFPSCLPLLGYDDWDAIKAYLAGSPKPHGPPPTEAADDQPSVSGVSPASGLVTGGTEVTISGRHFKDATLVRFGYLPAISFQVIDDHEIVAVTPDVSGVIGCGRGAGPVDMEVWAGGSASPVNPADKFTYADVLPHRSAVCITSVNPNLGPRTGGTRVTLTGWGFTGTAEVDFRDEQYLTEIPAPSFTVVDDNTINVVTPAAYLIDNRPLAEVGVVAAAGYSVLNPPYDQFTYGLFRPVEPPPAVVASISPQTGPSEGGTAVTITGSGFTNARGVFFGRFPMSGMRATSFTVINDTTIVAISPPEAGIQTVDVNVVDLGGDSLAVRGDQFSYDIPPPLPPTITGVSPATGPTAGGNTVTVIGSGFTGLTSLQVGLTLLTASSGAFTVLNDNTLTFTVPAGAIGTVDVIARSSAGFSAIGPADTYSYQ